MATLVIFKTSTEQLLHIQSNVKEQYGISLLSEPYFKHSRHTRADCTVEIIKENLTPNKLKLKKAVIDGKIKDKLRMSLSISKATIVADGVDSSNITAIPNATEVYNNGESVGVVTDGQISLSSAVVKTFKLTLKCDKYVDTEVIVDAT